MSVINSGEKFFAVLAASGIINRLINENPLSYVDYEDFEKELFRYFKNRTVSQSGIKASNWVRNEIKDLSDSIKDGRVDAWSDHIRIIEFYREQIRVEVWRFIVASQARQKRIDSLRLELLTMDNKPYAQQRLRNRIAILDERRAMINAWGPNFEDGVKAAKKLVPSDDEDYNPFLMEGSDSDDDIIIYSDSD